MSDEWSGGQYIILRATDHDAAGFKSGDVDGKQIQQGKWYLTEGKDWTFLSGPMASKAAAVEVLCARIRCETAATAPDPSKGTEAG